MADAIARLADVERASRREGALRKQLQDFHPRGDADPTTDDAAKFPVGAEWTNTASGERFLNIASVGWKKITHA